MREPRKAGATSVSIQVFIPDSTSLVGAGKTGLVFNTAALTAYYIRNKASASVISLVTQTVSGAWTSGGFVEIDSTNAPGLYRLDLPDAALAAGVDEVSVFIKGTGIVPVPVGIPLVAYDPQDAAALGLTNLNATISSRSTFAGGAVASVTAPVSVTAGQLFIKKNTALGNFTFLMVDTSGSPATGLTVAATRCIDGGAFASCANSVTEISAGAYKIDLANTDLNGTVIMLKFTATGAKPRYLTIVTQA